MFVEAVFKSTFGFSYVLFVTVVTLYHVNNVLGVAVNVMVNVQVYPRLNGGLKIPVISNGPSLRTKVVL